MEGDKTENIELMATGDSLPNPPLATLANPEPTGELNLGQLNEPAKNGEVVRTIFVSGLPMDTTPRELFLLFRNFKGFIESRLSTARNKYGKILSPVGFVTFVQRQEAEEALKELQDTIFDPYLPNTLRLEFAKCNSKISKDNSKKQYSPSPPVSGLSPTFLRNVSHQNWNSTNSMAWPPSTGVGTVSGSYGVSDPYFNPGSYVDSVFGSSSSVLSSPSLHSLPSTPTLNSSHTLSTQNPCSTLFVANLGSFVSEAEVAGIFGSCPGYMNTRLYSKGLTPVAFIKFIDVRCASQAMSALQGAFLRYSDRGGIRIEYAKSKMNDREGVNLGEGFNLTGGDNNHNGWTPYPLVNLDSWIDHRESREWPLFTGMESL